MNHKIKIYPAIDLKDGKCVRLYKGDMAQSTIFNDNPAAQAKAFQDKGFEFLHVVDLDGAIEGNAVNQISVQKILKNISMPIQLGGGIRSLADVKKWLELGVSRVIVGTLALKNPDLVIEIAKKFPKQIIVGIDARDGKVAVSGWVEKSEMTVIDLAKKFEDTGVAAIIYTDINRDGTLQGVDFDGTKNLAENVNIPIIASGGISSLQDVDELAKIEKLDGVIVGRALYTSTV